MPDNQNRLDILLEKFFENDISEYELNELCELIATTENRPEIRSRLLAELRSSSFTYLEKDKLDRMLGKVLPKHEALVYQMHTKRKSVWLKLAAACVIVLMLGAGIYWLVGKHPEKQIATTEKSSLQNDIAPGGNKAVLTLGNGQKIVLDSAANGTITQQGNTKIIKLDSGQLAYNLLNEKPGEVLYNTITTPRGGQYQIVLADGSKVWLNAASSLRYPASFTGNERKVELTGEGYFEVTKNAKMPFRVAVGVMNVQVLGTHFNINAYSDESSIKTTLLEGKVRVNSQSSIVNLAPGQQAVLVNASTGSGEQLTTKNNVDVDEVMAWKNGKFQFGEGADIASVMRQIARWYDVDVEYNGKVTGHIGGTISRNVNASQVFKMLEMTGSMKFEIEGRNVIVSQ